MNRLHKIFALLSAPFLLSGNSVSDDPMVITGIVDPMGVSGGQVGGEKHWSVSIPLIVWRRGQGEPQTSGLLLDIPGLSKAEMECWMALFKGGDVVRTRIDADPTPFNAIFRAEISDNIRRAKDDELVKIGTPLLDPPDYVHATLGCFVADKRILSSYDGAANWNGHQITLNLDAMRPDDLPGLAANAEKVIAEQNIWQKAAEAKIIEELYTLWAENWWDGEGEKLDQKQFLSKLEPTTVVFSAEGYVTIYYNDGDLFFGHAVTATGSLDAGIEYAEIAG